MSVTPGPRTRSWEVRKDATAVGAKYDFNTGALIADLSFTYDWCTTGNLMHDVVTENFLERSLRGEIINNPMDKIDYQTLITPSYYESVWPPYANPRYVNRGERVFERDYSIGFLTETDSDRAAIQSAIESCTTAAYAKVDSTTAALIPTLFELRETSKMLETAARKLLNLHVLLKNYKTQLEFATTWKRLKMVEQAIENTWMEIRLGWKPFFFEIGNLHKAMTTVEAFAARQTFRSGTRLTFQGADNPSAATSATRVDFQRTHLAFVNISAGVLCTQRYGGVPDTFGLTKFPQAVWELTKLSWCVDYFLNVGELIASFTPDSLWSPMTNWAVIRKKTTDTITLTGIEKLTPDYYINAWSPGSTKRQSVEVIRIPYVQRSFLPSWRPRLNWVRSIDSFFVARQLFGKKFMKGIMKTHAFVNKLRKK